MIDPFHLEAYGETTINYNRDVEVFPVLQAMFEKIMGECPYNLPQIWALIWPVTASLMMKSARKLHVRRSSADIIRAWKLWFAEQAAKKKFYKIELLLKQAHVTIEERKVVPAALKT